MSTSNIPLWGQAWELTILYAAEGGTTTTTTITSNSWDPEALRITFEVQQTMNKSPFWYADISVYNLNDPEIQNTLVNATWVTLKAGFQTGPTLYSRIWDGPIFLTTFTRESVVDQKVTMHCVANPLVMDSIVSFAMGPFSSQLQLVARMASEITLPPIDSASGTLGQKANAALSVKQYPRGNTVFGKVSKYIAQISDDNFMQHWQDGQKAYISEIGNADTTPSLIYSPAFPPGYTGQMLGLPAGTTQSILGTPRQTQFGATFTVLLDPRLSVQLPPLVVQLARTQISQLTITPSVNSQPATPLTADLKLLVAQVRHVGDTRGNDWQTEVTGVSTTYADNLLNGIFAPNSGS